MSPYGLNDLSCYTLRLAKHAHDLGVGETALLHRNLLVHLAEKILRSQPLNDGEDYQLRIVAA
jgi:hypothetical protein